jgi:predicted metal-dependent phosphoesterase TrpH
MHTTCSDGKNTYEEMIQTALKDRLSFIAITDHRTCADVVRMCKDEKRILCFPGQEVSSPGRHLLAINVQTYINPDLPLIKQVEEIHAQGGIAIAAHPNFKDYYYTDLKNTNDLKTAIASHKCSRATSLSLFSVQNANIKE